MSVCICMCVYMYVCVCVSPYRTPSTPMESRDGDVYMVDKEDLEGVWEVRQPLV
jgi:hypothetical protein